MTPCTEAMNLRRLQDDVVILLTTSFEIIRSSGGGVVQVKASRIEASKAVISAFDRVPGATCRQLLLRQSSCLGMQRPWKLDTPRTEDK